jgi:PAS domain S-box-containing protein
MSTISDSHAAPDSDIFSILAVDDDPTDLALLSSWLKTFGFRVIEAQDGETALEKAQDNRLDLFLLDVVLPKMNGFELCRRLKANESLRDIPVIFMTALTETANKVAGFRVGGADYVTKPFEREEVMARIKTHLALRLSQKQLAAQNDRLQREISERKSAEEALQQARAALENRVEARTIELAQAIASLKAENTEREKAESTIRLQRDFLQQLIDTIPAPVFYKDFEGRFMGCNAAYESFKAISRAELFGKTVYEVFPEELADTFREADLSLFSHPGVQHFETAVQDADGNMREVLFRKATFRDLEGKVAGLVGVIVDITERKLAEEQHRLQVRFLENLEQVERVIRQGQDLDKMAIEVLETVLSIFETDRAWLLYPCDPDASSFRVPMMHTRPEYSIELAPDMEVLMRPEVAEAVRIALVSDEPECFDPQSGRPVPLGEEFSIRSQMILAIHPRLGKPWVFGMHQCSHERVWTAEDQRLFSEIGRRMADGLSSMLLLHELRNNEEKYRASEQTLASILSASPIGIFHTVGRQIKWVNDAWLKMFGFEHEDECIGYSTRILYAFEEEYERMGRILYQELETGNVTESDAKLMRKDGTPFYGQIRITALNSSDPAKGTIGVVTDVTARKNAEEALRLSEEKYRILVDKAPVGIISVDNEGRILEVNQKLLEILGSPTADATKVLNMLSFGPLVASGISEVFASCMAYGAEQSAEIPYTSKWGKTSYLRMLLTPLVDESGYCKGCHAVMEDISERKKAEEALRQSEERYRATFSNAAVGIDLVNPEGQFLEANDTLLDFLGYSREELSDMTILDCTHPADVEKTKACHRAIVTGDSEGFRIEKRYVRKDGSVVWADTSVSAIRGKAGEYLATVAVMADITARKKSEEDAVLLATAIEQAAEAIVITDSKGTIAYVNPAFESTTGYSRREAIGANPRILKSGQQDAEFYTRMWQAISNGRVWTGHMVNKRKDDTLFEEEATISPVRDDSGKIVNYVAVKRDVTKEVALQRQLLQAQKMEAIGTLAGGFAHDFNNLLQVVLGYSELLLMDSNNTDPGYGDLQRITQAARSGADLVQRLLTFSRKTETKPRPLNLNHQIDRVRKMLSRIVPKMISIDLRLSESLANINADPTQMEQILMNLAVNARDAMPEGGQLTIETQNVVLDEEYCQSHLGPNPGEYVLLSVTDTGQGMDKETVEHIFEPFFTTKQLGQGTGLGLAMVYGIVENHGGHINCYSEPGRGTTFKIYLPAITSALEFEEQSAKPRPRGGSETILLVDDEDSIRELGARVLGTAGYTVLTATNGVEALDLYEKKRDSISLVILDVIMPKMGGKQCLEELLKIDPHAKVLIASGFAVDVSTKEALSAGARGFVPKPYDLQQVLRTVRDTLDSG